MTTAEVALLASRPATLPAVRRYCLGGPMLCARRARSVRRFAMANAVLVLLAGWMAGHGTYPELYGWLAVLGYLAVAVTVQLLSVLPTIRRLSAELE